METVTRSDSIVRFANFELDLRTRELSKNGSKVKLHGQPIDVLAILVQHPGDLVTRETIKKQLWPDDTFVDFEHILNNCIGKLREALGDHADSPKFIETLPRLGYRFIAPVVEPQQNQKADSDRSAFKSGAVSAQRVRSTGDVHTGRRLRKWILFVAGAVVLVIISSTVVWYLPKQLPRPQIKSIAVLPFENLSGNPSEEYLADGMTEELITELGAFGTFRVISRTSVMRFKGTSKPLPKIAQELGVDGIVEGTVTRSGNHVRITANLLDAETDRHLWANSYESEMEDILVVQSKVARAVTNAIRTEVAGHVLTPATQRRINPGAYQAYLEGRYYAGKWSLNGNTKAQEALRRSIDLDPTFAPAHSAISLFYFAQAINGDRPATELFPLARAAALKALELDDRLAEAHSAMAMVKQGFEWDWAGAELEHDRAVLLNPSSAEAHLWYGNFLATTGRSDEAVRENQDAVRLDPVSPDANLQLGWSLYFAGRHDESIAQLRKVLELDSKLAWANMELAWNYAKKNMYSDALVECERALEVAPENQIILASCGRIHGEAGRHREALALLDRLMALGKKGYVNPCDVAVIYDGIGDTNHAIEWLQRAYNERSASLVFIKIEYSERLHADPRFQALLAKLNFPA